MKINQLISVHALLLLGFGIAFALYGPMMLAFFTVPEQLGIDALTYWHVAAFARMFGAALFGCGLVLWALRPHISELSSTAQRGILFALLLANILALFVALTQQSSVWQTTAGWIASGIFALLTAGYAYTLAKFQSNR